MELLQLKKDGDRSREGGLDRVPFRIWLPDGQEVVRGVVFNPFHTDAVRQEHWRAACRHWGFGILAANLFGAQQDEMPRLIDAALEEFARESGLHELARAVMCPVGMSAGAGMCVRIADLMPGRVVAVGAVCLEVGPRDAASMEIPTLTVFGERDGRQYEQLMEKLPEVRAQDGRFAIAVQWGRRHEFAQANNLVIPWFDAAIRARVGAPGEPLRPIAEEDGWLGAVTGWREGQATVARFADFPGEKERACWFPDEATARSWQAFVKHEPALRIETPAGLGDGQPFASHRAGQPITVEVAGDPAVAGSIEVHGGSGRLGELAGGKLEVVFDKPGIHVLILRATSADGEPLSSRPHVLIVAGGDDE